jgi:hypothetical protein
MNMRRIAAVLAIATGALLYGESLTAEHAQASAVAQDTQPRLVVFESFMRSA